VGLIYTTYEGILGLFARIGVMRKIEMRRMKIVLIIGCYSNY